MQYIDKEGKRHDIPLYSVQPILDPDGGLVENDKGIALKDDIEIRQIQPKEPNQGAAFLIRKGKLVQVLLRGLVTESTESRNVLSENLPVPLFKTASMVFSLIDWYNNESYACHAILYGSGILDIKSSKPGAGKFGTITYICE